MLSKLKRLGVEPGKPFNRSSVDPAIIRGVNRVPPQIWLKWGALKKRAQIHSKRTNREHHAAARAAGRVRRGRKPSGSKTVFLAQW